MAKGHRATRTKKKKKKLLTAREHEPGASPVSGLWTSWCRSVPQCPFVAMPGPPNRLICNTLPFTPAHGAFIGPKHHDLTIVLEMDVTASAQLMLPLPLVQLPSQTKRALPTPCIEAAQGGSAFACSPSDEMPRQQVTYAESACNLVQFQPRWTRLTGTADQSILQVSLALISALTCQSLPFRSLRSKCPFSCWIGAVFKQLRHSLRLRLPPPPFGRGGVQKKKKKHPGGWDAYALPDFHSHSDHFVGVKELWLSVSDLCFCVDGATFDSPFEIFRQCYGALALLYWLRAFPSPPKKKKKRGKKKVGRRRIVYLRMPRLLRRLLVGFGRVFCYFVAVLILPIEMNWVFWVL